MNDIGDMRRSEGDYQRSGEGVHGRSGLIANLILGFALACFVAVEVGYIANIAALSSLQALFALVFFMVAVLAVYLAARYLPLTALRHRPLIGDAAAIFLALLYGGALVYLHIKGLADGESLPLFAIALLAALAGLLTCIGLLKCYGHLSEMGDESPKNLLYVALTAGVILFIIIYWLVNPARVVAFSLLPLFGYIALFAGRKEIKVAQSNRLISQQATAQASEFLSAQPIHLNRYTHFVMFALELALAYCIGATMQTWTPLSVSCTAALTVAACVIIRQTTKKRQLALGELGKIALPVCIALLFCVVPNLADINFIVAPVATALFLLLGAMNALWLIRTATLFDLNAAKHISAGKLPLIIGTVCGFALGYVLSAFNSQAQLGLFVAGAVAVVLVATYTLLPFNQGTPVKEGIMYSDLLSPTKTSNSKQARPFKELCSEFGQTHGLTSREQEVLFLLACGYNSETIAQILIVSGNTVRTHVYRIYQKTDIHSQQDLIKTLDTLLAERPSK